MRPFLAWFFCSFLRLVLKLRYKIEVKGLDQLTEKKLNRPKGVVFFANHPAEIDPCVLVAVFWPRFRIHPIAIDYLFRKPGVRFFLDLIDSLSIPNFEGSSNSFKRNQMEKTYKEIFSLIDKKENILIYPSGGLKVGPEEVLGGASGAHRIIQTRPDANVVLVRTTGLWGSSFSRAQTGTTPEIGAVFLNGFKVLLKNLIFFTPRRKVCVECIPAPSDFPWSASRRDFNRYLENWFNQNGPEPLSLISYSIFKKVYPEIKERKTADSEIIKNVSEDVKQQIFEEISNLTKIPVNEISEKQNLALDLGLDSLDTAQLVVTLKENYGVTSVQSSDLVTISDLLAFASGFKKGKVEEEEIFRESVWNNEKNRPEPFYPEGKNLVELFFKTCKRMKGYFACADQMTGEMSYRKLQYIVILLAQKIRELPGKRIGILMPASVVGNALILACMLAGKIPLMINWTLGQRNLRSILDQAKIELTISSWNFLNRLENIELNGIDDQIILLEEMKREFSFLDYASAYLKSFKSPHALLKAFKLELNGDDCAVILFTSGTESYPKGVPLSHKNIIFNQQGAFEMVNVNKDDVLLGALPPFHSFGFSVTGLLPLIAGLRVAYSPNPTDGRRIAQAIDKWKINLLCLAPTFLKNLLRVAQDELKSLRLIVLGAERTPEEIYIKSKELNPDVKVLEGYGITECAPILTLNPPHLPSHGVGRPFPGVHILIVDPDTLMPLPLGKQGLILVRGPNIFKGYLDPHLPSPFIDVEGQKWYKTGDLGFLNEQGYLTLSGRLKRFIKMGGEMISLTAIEEILISQSVKRGWVSNPEAPTLAICAKEEEGKKSEIHLYAIFDSKPEEINAILRECGMSNLIKIKAIHKVNVIPQLGTGKIDYHRLNDKLNEISS